MGTLVSAEELATWLTSEANKIASDIDAGSMGANADLDKYRNDLSQAPPRPQSVFLTDGRPLATLGNLVVLTGKAKTQKSALAALLCGLHLNPASPRLGSAKALQAATLAGGRCGAIYFDTEQGPWHVTQLHRRVAWLANRPTDANGANLHVFALRELPVAERLSVIEQALDEHAAMCPFVVVDGARDLLDDINDAGASNGLVTRLLQLSTRHAALIALIIHENKGSDQVRGHLGTEAVNKCELVLRTTRDERLPKGIVAVDAPHARNVSPDAFFLASYETTLADGSLLWAPTLEETVSMPAARQKFARTAGISVADFQVIAASGFAGLEEQTVSSFRALASEKLVELQGAESCSEPVARALVDLLVARGYVVRQGTTKNAVLKPGERFIHQHFTGSETPNRLSL